MIKQLIILLSLTFSVSVGFAQNRNKEVNQVMDSWHLAASKADFKAYFDLMDAESVFIGTDATERWDKPSFMAYAKPHFDKGKAWSFTTLERFVNFSADGKTAWIDELLNTQMKICRGSGVLVNKGGKWLIKHYVLSMTIPNELSNQVIPLKAPIEDKIIKDLNTKRR